MRTKLTALLAAIALFGAVGAAQADSITPTGTPALSLTDTWSLPSTDTQPGTRIDTQVVTLTDGQMDEVTAGVWVLYRTYTYYYLGRLYQIRYYYWR